VTILEIFCVLQKELEFLVFFQLIYFIPGRATLKFDVKIEISCSFWVKVHYFFLQEHQGRISQNFLPSFLRDGAMGGLNHKNLTKKVLITLVIRPHIRIMVKISYVSFCENEPSFINFSFNLLSFKQDILCLFNSLEVWNDVKKNFVVNYTSYFSTSVGHCHIHPSQTFEARRSLGQVHYDLYSQILG
jgi:hypothetical protein